MDKCCLPYSTYIDTKIFMNQEISQGDHLSSRNMWVSLLYRKWNTIARFPNNLKITNDCIHHLFIFLNSAAVIPSVYRLILSMACRMSLMQRQISRRHAWLHLRFSFSKLGGGRGYSQDQLHILTGLLSKI